jgi:cellulose synthase/poly-beta-1,6-N-acetylglucosamine synthase-like glycosyltransferase
MSPAVTTALTLTFWVSCGVIFYTFLIYPIILLCLAGAQQLFSDLGFVIRRRTRRSEISDDDLPFVSLVFAAYNEEQVIAGKMDNCALIEYPADRLEIIMGCDGCSDRTAELARSRQPKNVRIIEYTQRRGKPTTLNSLVAEAAGGIVVFSDANTALEPGAIRTLVRHFGDPKTGCVCGEVRLMVHEDGGPPSEGVYWRYEVFLKFLESRLNALLGANGPLFAIRKRLYTDLTPEAICDDFLIAMQIRAKGYKVLYDPEAICHEETAPSVQSEFKRRVRIGAGNFHALRLTSSLLSPTAGWIAFSYWSHKVIRWLVPFATLLATVAAVGLSYQPLYAAATAMAILLGGLATVGRYLELRKRYRTVFSVPYYFLSMNFALLLGFFRFLNRRQTSVWERTARQKLEASASADRKVTSLD